MKYLSLIILFLMASVSEPAKATTSNAEPEVKKTENVIPANGVTYDPNYTVNTKTHRNSPFFNFNGFDVFKIMETEVFTEMFNAVASVDGWTQANDASTKPAEVTFEWDETAGVDASGAMRFGGVNADGEGGRAYVIEKVFTGIDFGGETSATVTVAVKSGGLLGTDVAILTDIGGSVQQNTNTLSDLSESAYTTFTFVHPSISSQANSVKLSFNVAAGAGVDLGGTIFIDDIKVTAAPGNNEPTPAPETAAPTPPARNAADVISIFSDAYTSITLDTLSADFDDSDVEVVMIDGNSTLRIDFTNFVGIDFQSNKQDASAMTHFHMDFWTSSPDLVGKVFNSKFSQWGGGAGEVSALELNINTATTPAIETDTWVSIDVPFTSWTNTPAARDDIAQFLITSNLDVVYVDNIYLYKDVPTSNENKEELPEGFKLNQNYPNPFNPSTNISYSIPASGEVMLEVFNIQGQRVATLVEGFKSAGSYNLTFNASNLASGVYTYKLTAGNSVQFKKMLLIK